MLIYEPKGKAREYSPLAINLYSGCGHKCSYCYVPQVIKVTRTKFDSEIEGRKNVILTLKKEIKKFAYSQKQVFMSFTTDPYNPIDEQLKLTRTALILFLENKIPISILTKSGKKALRDLDIMKKYGDHFKIGASLTYDNQKDSERIESGAALPEERLEMLKIFKQNKIRTWASFEPILQPEQTLNMIKKGINFIDEFQIGKLANDSRKFDWTKFLTQVVEILRNERKEFYIKETLREAAKIFLNPAEYDMDYLTLKPFRKELSESLFT